MLKKKIEKLRQALSNRHLIDEVKIPTTKKERLEANKRAEQLVKDIEEGKLEVTNEIKKELLKFTGYGALGGLDNDEYYTPKEIAKGAWKALELPKGSKVLDPSTGIGIFSATAPNGINIIGCDLNPISGKIANIVNDNSKIESGISFEEYSKQLEPKSLDAVITNVPFGNRDTQLQAIDMPNVTRNEDYFILKSLQLLKGGKRAVFLTTSSTAQRANRQDSRIEMFKLASFIGGTRLPSEMFKDTGTEQVVDVLVFEKHPDIALDSDIVPDEVNQDFIDGVYFDKRPNRVLGTFKSREQAIQDAEKAGVKLHHQAQKDVVTLPPNTTIEDIKANFSLPNFKNGIDYSAVAHIEKSKQDVKKDNLKDWLLDYAEKLEAGKIAKLVNYKKFVKKYNEAINLGIQFSERNNILLYARLVADTQFKMKLFFKEITKEDILENKKEIEKWLKSTPKTHPYNSLVVEKWNYLSKFDLETGEFITDITTLIGMEDEGVFKDKESITTNYQKAYSLDSFTKDELMQDDVFIDNNLVFKREDWLVYNRGKSFKNLFTVKPDNLTEEEWQVKRDNMIQQLEEDYSTNTDISKFKVPLSLIPEIFEPELVRRLEQMAKGLNSVKKQCKDNSIQALNAINDDNEGKNLYDKIIAYNAYSKYIEHLFYDKSLYLFDRNINIEEKLLERCKFIVKEEYYKTAEVITTVIDNYIHNNPAYASVLQKWLDDKKSIDYDYQGNYSICNELNGYIKNTMLSRARHYQNADSRKFAKEMDGICAYSTGLGKAHKNSEFIIVNGEPKTIGDIKVGDYVIGSNGKPTKVLAVYPQGKLTNYEIEFIDGTKVECSKEHLWTVKDRFNNGKWKTLELQEMLANGLYKEYIDPRSNNTLKEYRYSIPHTPICEFSNNKKLLIHPYILGVLLGDGGLSRSSITFTNSNEQIVNKIKKLLPNGYVLTKKGIKYTIKYTKNNTNPFITELKRLGLKGKKSIEKFIPDDYLFNSLENRKHLYQGLVDTDGHKLPTGKIEFSSSSKKLIEDYRTLAFSLGKQLGVISVRKEPKYTHNGEKRTGQTNYRVTERTGRSLTKTIVNIKKLDTKEEHTCITVDAEDSLYLVGRDLIVTHNTRFSLMTASQMLVRGSAKRVAYVVPNAIFSKIVNEAKNTLTEKMLKKTLFIDNKNKADINRLKTDKTIQFVIFSAPTVITQFKLHKENLDLLWGANPKEENTDNDKKYPPNKLRNWIKRYPTYSSNAKYYWEDTGIDAIIIDEAHHHKNAVASATAGVKGLNPTTTNESVVLLTFVEYIKGLKRKDMKGCVLTTATPATSSPTELETMLVFSTDRKALESKVIYDSKAFEKRFFTIVKKNVLKTDGLNYAERKVLTGLTNLEQMREVGLNKVLYRTAEQEEAVARERGQTIVVKPYSEEYQAEIDTDIQEDYNKLTMLNIKFSNDIRQFNKGMLEITEDNAMYMVLAKEYGEIFGYINRVNKLAINNAFAYGYTKIKLDKPMSKDEIFNLIGDIKIPYKIAEVKKEKYGNTLIIKNAEIEIKNYYNTEYYLKQVELDIPTYSIVEDDYLYLPSIDYMVIKKVLSKIKGSFVKKDYPKLSGVVDNILNELKRKPKAKQIIYATTLATHHILEHLIKANIKEVKKIWHFNGTALKNADARLKVQEDFNNFNDVGIMIFGRAGEVGVDFNKNVSAVHLLDIGQTPDAREQAKGRAVRQGNTMDKVNVYNYFANGTFDKFLMDLTVGKSNWINAVANKNIQSTDYSDDSIETISNEAQRKYGHLNIPLEEKIQKYLEDVQKEKEQFRRATNNAIIDAELRDLYSFKNTYEDKTNYTMDLFLTLNNYRTYFYKDQLKGISLKYYPDASYNELESILECENFYPYGGAVLTDMKEANKQQYEELKAKAIEQLKDIDEEILEWYNTKADDKRKKYFEKLVKDPNAPFTSVYSEKLDLLYSNYEFVYNQWVNRDEIINNKLKGLYDKIDNNVTFEIFKDNIDLITIENGVYKLPDLTEVEFYYKSGYYSFDPYLIGYKGVVAKIKDKEIQEYSKIDYSTWKKYTTVERFIKDTRKEIDVINEVMKNIDEGNYTLATNNEVEKVEEAPIYIIDNGGYVAFAYKDYEKLLYTRSGKIIDSKYPIKKYRADTYKTLEELANSNVTAKERIIEWITENQ